MRKSASKKRPTAAAPLSAAVRKAALRAQSGIERKAPEPPAAPQNYPIGKSRKALKGVSIYMHPLAKDVLDRIASEHDRTVQALGIEALNLLFRHYGEKPIA